MNSEVWTLSYSDCNLYTQLVHLGHVCTVIFLTTDHVVYRVYCLLISVGNCSTAVSCCLVPALQYCDTPDQTLDHFLSSHRPLVSAAVCCLDIDLQRKYFQTKLATTNHRLGLMIRKMGIFYELEVILYGWNFIDDNLSSKVIK